MKLRRQILESRFVRKTRSQGPENLEKSGSDAALVFPSRHLLINICRVSNQKAAEIEWSLRQCCRNKILSSRPIKKEEV